MKSKNAQAVQDREFSSFEEMMSELSGLKLKDLKELNLKDPEQNSRFQAVIEDDGEFGCIFACYPNDDLVRAVCEEHGLNVVTQSIEDGDESSFYCYATGMNFVNRERYFFCRSDVQGYCEEEV